MYTHSKGLWKLKQIKSPFVRGWMEEGTGRLNEGEDI